jgi:molybdopterin-guanine dinucleotide biosynthesis protein A
MKSLFLCGGNPVSLIVLAGGSSRRMKEYKALLPVAGITLIEHALAQLVSFFDEVLISLSDRGELSFLPFSLVVDERPDEGPMMGIKSALKNARNEKSFVIACDIPDADLDLVQKMISLAVDYEIVVPLLPGNKPEPLFAVYSRSVISESEQLLDSGERSLLRLFERCKTRFVKVDDSSWYKNLNTWKNYKSFLNEK